MEAREPVVSDGGLSSKARYIFVCLAWPSGLLLFKETDGRWCTVRLLHKDLPVHRASITNWVHDLWDLFHLFPRTLSLSQENLLSLRNKLSFIFHHIIGNYSLWSIIDHNALMRHDLLADAPVSRQEAWHKPSPYLSERIPIGRLFLCNEVLCSLGNSEWVLKEVIFYHVSWLLFVPYKESRTTSNLHFARLIILPTACLLQMTSLKDKLRRRLGECRESLIYRSFSQLFEEFRNIFSNLRVECLICRPWGLNERVSFNNWGYVVASILLSNFMVVTIT